MKRFYLSAQRTFENRGCEAIVRSTVNALHRQFGDIHVLVPSDNLARDAEQWPEAPGHGVELVPAYTPAHTRYWVHSQRLPIPMLKRAGWPFPFPRWFRDQIDSVDAVLSIGGDNYSLDYRLPSQLMGMDALAMDMGKPVFLWGASVGPFERERHFVATIREHLSRLRQIYVRESVSYRYLTETLSLENVGLMVDPAFTLVPQVTDCSPWWPEDAGSGIAGLNISPLIERYRQSGQDLASEAGLFVRALVEEKGYGVLLVPHVVPFSGRQKNNDEAYMARILQACSDLAPRVSMSPSNLNASQLKYVISRLRFFIGARTHATIAALSSGVPTVSIAYSVKAVGINRDLFGDEPVVLPTPEVSRVSLMDRLTHLEAHEAEFRAVLERAGDRHQQIVSAAMADIGRRMS